MAIRENIKNYFRRIRVKHKLTFINDSNYHEKWSVRVSSMNLFTLVALYTIVVVVGLLLLLNYTPLKAIIIDDDMYASQAQINENTKQIGSISKAYNQQTKYMRDLRSILRDEPIEDELKGEMGDSLVDNYLPDFSKSKEDSILRAKVAKEEQARSKHVENVGYEFFFPPVVGIVSQSFNIADEHYGVDIATTEDAPIKACLEGTVIFTGWVLTDGNTITVQHKNNLVSVYKHCSLILKKQGEKVQLGDPIAIVGNTGENTSGPHLHFELWKNGRFLNPELYISFNE